MKQIKIVEEICKEREIDISRYTFPLEKESFPNYPTSRFVHFVVLITLKDFTIFTQDGQTILTKNTSEIIGSDEKVTRGVMFQRKVTASLRRKMMEILRTYAQDIMELDNGNITEIKSINPFTPDASLFGFAVGDSEEKKGDKIVAFCGKSRILSGSAFTIRPLSDEVTQFITFNAQSDKTRVEDPSTALGEKEFFLPETVFPMILTLRDPSVEDILFLMYVLNQTKREGAVSTRTGHAINDLIGIYFSHEEFPSNLELSQMIYEKMADKTKLPKELGQLTIDGIGALCDEGRIRSKFLDKEGMYILYDKVFSSDEVIAKWIREYTADYFDILTYLDLQNAGLKNTDKKYKGRTEELEKLQKEVASLIK